MGRRWPRRAALAGFCWLALLTSGCAPQRADEGIYLSRQHGHELALVGEGKVVHFRGEITENVDAEFAALVDANPQVRGVILDSTGGRVREALKMSRFIARRSLNTHSARGCYSACTYVYIAGETRTVTRGAKLGFHQISTPDDEQINDAELALLHDIVKRSFAARRVRASFRKELFAVPPDEMWYPGADRLISDGVVHDVVEHDGFGLSLLSN